jgi:hypothetical protein
VLATTPCLQSFQKPLEDMDEIFRNNPYVVYVPKFPRYTHGTTMWPSLHSQIIHNYSIHRSGCWLCTYISVPAKNIVVDFATSTPSSPPPPGVVSVLKEKIYGKIKMWLLFNVLTILQRWRYFKKSLAGVDNIWNINKLQIGVDNILHNAT